MSIHTPQPPPGKYLAASLWLAQAVVSLLFIASGATKLFMPIADLAAMMHWPGEYPLVFVRSLALVDIAGGLGILLPSLTRVQPRLGVLAASGCVAVQLLAIGFHGARGEFSVLPLNFVLLAGSGFVLWGRGLRAPISARHGGPSHPG